MGELRWILVVCGLLLFAGIFIYSRWRAGRTGDDKPRREPVLPEMEPGETGSETPSEPPPPARPRTPDKVIALRLMSRSKPGFGGEKLVLALREAGLRHGRYGIFHHHEDSEGEPVQFSVASLVEPGSFDLSGLKEARFPGISFFLALPSEADPVQSFDKMLATSRELARKLGGDLLDEQGSTLSIQRQRFMREEILQYLHRHSGASDEAG